MTGKGQEGKPPPRRPTHAPPSPRTDVASPHRTAHHTTQCPLEQAPWQETPHAEAQHLQRAAASGPRWYSAASPPPSATATTNAPRGHTPICAPTLRWRTWPAILPVAAPGAAFGPPSPAARHRRRRRRRGRGPHRHRGPRRPHCRHHLHPRRQLARLGRAPVPAGQALFQTDPFCLSGPQELPPLQPCHSCCARS